MRESLVGRHFWLLSGRDLCFVKVVRDDGGDLVVDWNGWRSSCCKAALLTYDQAIDKCDNEIERWTLLRERVKGEWE